MGEVENRGFDGKVIAEYRAKIAATKKSFVFTEEDERNNEYAHFYFVGKYDGDDVVYDAVLYTLRLQHESELFELAEHKAAQHFPQYRKITYQEDENGNLKTLDDLEEEIGLFMAEAIMEMEEDGEVKVQEHVDVDPHLDFGIGLDIGLHVEEVTPDVIEKFIREFNSGSLVLDKELYTFQTSAQTS